MNSDEFASNEPKFKKILAAIEIFRNQDRKTSAMLFTDNWYDSHPRFLIFDPVLNPYDKVVWLVIRSRCSPEMALTAFPTYDELQTWLKISRGTVAASITKLRLTRWITVLQREQVRNSSGRITKDGNIYMVHGEPLSLKDTFGFDSDYMGFVDCCLSHRSAEIKRVAETIMNSIHRGITDDHDVLLDNHPFERRYDAWVSLSGDNSANFFSYHSTALSDQDSVIKSKPDASPNRTPSTVVHELNYGDPSDSVHHMNPARATYYGKSVSSNFKNNNYKQTYEHTNEYDENLIFPKSVSENQKHIICLHLSRIPDDLPPPPKPWPSWKQLLLDELDGRIRIAANGRYEPVHNPVSLMSAYCQRLITNGLGLKEEGKFQIELAESIFNKRVTRERNKRAVELARRNYLEKTAKRLSEYENERSKHVNESSEKTKSE